MHYLYLFSKWFVFMTVCVLGVSVRLGVCVIFVVRGGFFHILLILFFYHL